MSFNARRIKQVSSYIFNFDFASVTCFSWGVNPASFDAEFKVYHGSWSPKIIRAWFWSNSKLQASNFMQENFPYQCNIFEMYIHVCTIITILFYGSSTFSQRKTVLIGSSITFQKFWKQFSENHNFPKIIIYQKLMRKSSSTLKKCYFNSIKAC